MDIKFQVQTKIQKPVAAVFDAVYDPQKLDSYFTNGGASGPLDEGTTVEWSFADTPGEIVGPFPVIVTKMIKNKLINFEWEGTADRDNTLVEMEFEPDGPDQTIVRISESGWKENDADLKRSYGNCMGWSHMVSALKAFTEYGINLRKGAYEGLYKAADHK